MNKEKKFQHEEPIHSKQEHKDERTTLCYHKHSKTNTENQHQY